MAMRNMWWHFGFFFSVRQIFFRSGKLEKLSDRMSDKLSWIFDRSGVRGMHIL